MKYLFTLFYLVLAIYFLIPDYSYCKSLGKFLGTFEIHKNPLIPSKENLNKEFEKIKKSGCKKTTRVAILTNSSFIPSNIQTFGWKIVAQVGDVVTIEGCEELLPYITAIDGIIAVDKRTKFYPAMDSARSQAHINEVHGTVPNFLTRHFSGKGVLLGFLDTGFEPHHPAFLDSLGRTRFIALWDQTDTSKSRPNRFGYGLIKFQQEIQNDTLFGTQNSGHGTIVASTGAGSDKAYPYIGSAPQATIIAVKYGNTVANFIDGLKWVFSVADSLKMPCVVNMSIGIQEGPHDGTSLMDRTIDALSGAGRIVVGAAGNDGDKKVHVKFTLGAQISQGTWFWPEIVTDSISPTNVKQYSVSLIDIWGEANKNFTDTLYLIDISNGSYKKSGRVLSTNTNSQALDTILYPNSQTGPDTVIFYSWVERRNGANQKPHIEVGVFSTNINLIAGCKLASTVSHTIHAWNCYKKNLVSLGLTGFIDGDTLYSINEVGSTAKRIISVGSYFSKTQQKLWDGTISGEGDTTLYMWATWSSIGPTVDGRIKPEICAPGRMVVGAMSSHAIDIGRICAWPNPQNKRGRYEWTQGTSISAPIVAGIIALMLEANPSLTPEEAVQILQQSATKDKYTGNLTSLDVRWGAGKVNALEALKGMGIPVEIKSNTFYFNSITGLSYIKTKNKLLIKYNEKNVNNSYKYLCKIFDLKGRLHYSKIMTNNDHSFLVTLPYNQCFIIEITFQNKKYAAKIFSGI